MSFNHSKNYGLPPRRSWFNLRKPAAEVDRVFAVSGGATLVSSHGVSWRNVPGIRAHFVSIDCVHHVSYISLSFIEWASAQVPPTPLYLGGTVGRERDREGEGEGEGEMDGWMDG